MCIRDSTSGSSGSSGSAGTSGTDWVAVLGFDAIVNVSNVKLESSYASELKSVAKQVIGTCQCLGIKIEGKTPKEMTAEINSGKWDEKLIVNS